MTHSWDVPAHRWCGLAPTPAQDNGHESIANGDEIRQELGRIVTSAGFRDSLRLTSFITFVVETTLAGNSDRIKAYTIAVEALGRGGDFDPQTDAIVRVEAGRLRYALARYYAGEGRNDPLVIDLPRGGYVPAFRRPMRVPSCVAPLRSEARDLATGDIHSAPPNSRPQQVKLEAVFERLIELRWRQIDALAAEIEVVREILERADERRRG